jgi:beta-glucanase (GH16 family)
MGARQRRRTAAVVLGLTLALTLLACATSSHDAGASGSAVRCGPSTTIRVGSRTWTCTFDDEFNGTALDPQRWAVQTTGASGWTTSDTCYVNSPATIAEGGGALHLVARAIPTPTSCGRGSTHHLGGAVMSKGRFAQTYGRFEIRARFPAATLPGFWGDLWLYPERLTYGAWPDSGEIDIAEHWTGHSGYVSSSLHYRGSSGVDSRACAVADMTAFHVYRLEWGPYSMSFFIDDHPCFTRTWVGTTGSLVPFNRPFFVMLSEGFGDFDQPTSPRLPPVGPVDVDYVRVYR